MDAKEILLDIQEVLLQDITDSDDKMMNKFKEYLIDNTVEITIEPRKLVKWLVIELSKKEYNDELCSWSENISIIKPLW